MAQVAHVMLRKTCGANSSQSTIFLPLKCSTVICTYSEQEFFDNILPRQVDIAGVFKTCSASLISQLYALQHNSFVLWWVHAYIWTGDVLSSRDCSLLFFAVKISTKNSVIYYDLSIWRPLSNVFTDKKNLQQDKHFLIPCSLACPHIEKQNSALFLTATNGKFI